MNDISKSIVLVVKDNGSPAGTAFLFRNEEQFSYLLTCHHVISQIANIKVKIDGDLFEATYQEKYSDPFKDVAVIKIELSPLLKCNVIKMGKVYSNINTCKHDKNEGSGFIHGFPGGKIDNYPNGMQIKLGYSIGNNENIEIHTGKDKIAIDSLRNSWNVYVPSMKMLFLDLFSSRRKIVGGFSGSPLIVSDFRGGYFCIGMVSQSTKKGAADDSLEGVAIPYEEIEDLISNIVPFFNYSDCVIIVLAGKRHEIISKENAVDNRCYHNLDRESWKPYKEEKAIKNMIDYSLDEDKGFYQFSSAYIDVNSQELDNFITGEMEGLIFVIDKCSLNIDALDTYIDFADREAKRASYIFVESDSVQEIDFAEKLRKDRLPSVGKLPAFESKTAECYRKQDVEKEIKRIYKLAVTHSKIFHLYIDEKLSAENVPQSNFHSLPSISNKVT